jgi:hypothetical protein
MSTVTRPRRTTIEVLPREAMCADPRASIADIRAVWLVKPRSEPEVFRTVTFAYLPGKWDCDCPAGLAGAHCTHVATCEWWARYDAAYDWISRLSPADLTEYDQRIASADRGIVPGWVGLDVDRAVVGDVLAARLGPSSRSGISVEQCRGELFG